MALLLSLGGGGSPITSITTTSATHIISIGHRLSSFLFPSTLGLRSIPKFTHCSPYRLCREFISTSSFISHSSENKIPTSSQRFKPNLEHAKQHLPSKRFIPNVKKVIMVTSAKGGVGKSTVAVHLAYMLALRHFKVGILDTDLHGPSVPTLLNIQGISPDLTADHRLKPVVNYNLQCMSMGLLAPSNTSIAWRGLMVMKALSQLLFQVAWDPPLDYLVMDLPPGTSDVHLSIAQQVEIAGAIVVSTAHALSTADAIKGIDLLRRCNIPILGLVHNMAYFICPSCTSRHPMFGTDSLVSTDLASATVPVLVALPFDPSHSLAALHDPTSSIAKAYETLAKQVVEKTGCAGKVEE